MFGKSKEEKTFKYPGVRSAMDGNTAVIMCEREAADAAGAYPITPSTQMGEYWAEETAKGHINVSGRPLIFVEPEGEHAAAAVTAGMSMSGLRASNFSSSQGIAYMHESLYAAVGKRLPYVLNIGARAITKSTLNVHCGHDDYHCIDDTGFLQLFGNSAQGAADLNLIGRRVAELSLTPAAVAQDGFLTTHLIEPLNVPERELIAEFLGRPEDMIDCPTPAQRHIYGEKRRRVPELWTVDNPIQSGLVQNQDSYMQAVVAQRPYFFDHIRDFTDQAMEEFYELTGRRYRRVSGYGYEDADYLIVGQGSMVVQAQAVADYLLESRGIKLGVIDITMFRPFPGDLLGEMLQGKKGVAVLERTDQPLAEDLPLMREIRAVLTKCLENGQVTNGDGLPFPQHASIRPADMPRLYSCCYGLGSRDLQPEGLVAAVENMLPDGGHKRFFYLSVDFVRDPLDPREEVRLQELLDAYPHIAELALHGSENPNLLPRDAITVRMHSVGGWGAVTTGKNLSMLMFDLLGYDIRANPKYGSEKKGQPTTYFLSAAPEPIRLNCEYHYVDLVMSPDPNVFTHSNPLFGLQPGGVFIIQSSLGDGDAVWAQIPDSAQQYVVDNDIRVYFLDGFRIARDEASDPELQYRMQGNAFQGAFFAASSVMERAGLDEQGLFRAIEDRLRKKFGSKGERVVQDNLRVVHRGFDELVEIIDKPVTGTSAEFGIKVGLPRMLKQLPEGRGGMSDVHRFWEQTGVLYASGRANDNLADPFQAMGIMPASSGVYRDMTQIRFEYPKFVPENCTACGNCFTACPDSAIPGLVNSIGDVFAAAIQRVERTTPTQHLRRETRNVEKKLHAFIDTEGEGANVSQLLDRAVLEHLTESDFQGEQKTVLEQEFGLFLEALEGFQFSITKPYWKVREKKQAGSGGLFSITVNPYTCKGCNECIDVCDDDALVAEPQTQEGVNWLRDNWDIWLDLPTTKPEFIRVDDLDEKVGALETLLLDKHNYQSVMSGDGACMGCGEKTVIHLFTATVTALMQPRVKAHLAEIEDLINRLETHIRLKLASSMDLTDRDAIQQAVASHKDSDLTLGDLSDSLDQEHRATPVDSEWLNWVTGLLDDLRRLRHRYTDGGSGSGRVEMGIVNATGCSSVWGSTFPYNPYPFPWTNHLFQDTASVSLGLFEGHMRNMAEGFRAVRLARLELDGKYDASQHDDFFKRFAWRDFSEEEWRLCPPVVAVGGDGAMYDIGFQNLSRALMTGMPVKIMVLDTQVYSNTGGQACTSGFVSQVSDMAPYGPAWKGKREKRKEMSLIATAHRSAFVLQSSASHVTHLLEGYIDGLNSRRPALFNIYTPCQPEHGIGDDASNLRSRMAVESRAYPLFRFDPDAGSSFHDCCSLETNPSIGEDWITHRISYEDDNGKPAEMEVPFTFADFTLGEGRFRKHFRKAPRDSWNEDMTPVAEYIDLDPDDREGLYPFIWGVDKKNQLMRVLVSPELVASVEERREYWRQLQSIVAEEELVCEEDLIIQRTRSEMAQQLGQALMTLVNGGAAPALGELPSPAIPPVPGVVPGAEAEAAAAEGYEPAWIDTPECTACDECMNINAKIFAYNEEKKATVINPRGGPYKDIVKAAEKCTASCIHPGTPWNPKERGLEKLVKRAAKFQ